MVSPTTPSCDPAWNKPMTWKDLMSFGKDSGRWNMCINMHLRYSGSDAGHDALLCLLMKCVKSYTSPSVLRYLIF